MRFALSKEKYDVVHFLHRLYSPLTVCGINTVNLKGRQTMSTIAKWVRGCESCAAAVKKLKQPPRHFA